MGHHTIIYGRINGATWKTEDYDKLQRLNAEVIERLPDNDSGFPCINRSMFAIPNEQGTYRDQIITFGASYKTLEYEWHLWIEKFEALLKTLFWVDVTIHADFEMMGTFTYNWIISHELIPQHWHQASPQPIMEWQFESTGPRTFKEELGR